MIKLKDILKEEVDKKWQKNWYDATSSLLKAIGWVGALTYAPKVPDEVKNDQKLKKLKLELEKVYDKIVKHSDKMGY